MRAARVAAAPTSPSLKTPRTRKAATSKRQAAEEPAAAGSSSSPAAASATAPSSAGRSPAKETAAAAAASSQPPVVLQEGDSPVLVFAILGILGALVVFIVYQALTGQLLIEHKGAK